ncbi:hypothetical protein B566_EDAN002075 [Ephemera danica]|nr:hypothetical protein B566_EDAN002075 [Ephemera danica]
MLSWIEAVAFCRLYGMDLASIESREEDVLIANHLNEIGLKMTVYVWISGNKIGRAAYMWLNGEQLIYENWTAGEPGNFATEHCIGTNKGTWYDLPCINSYHFICEEP